MVVLFLTASLSGPRLAFLERLALRARLWLRDPDLLLPRLLLWLRLRLLAPLPACLALELAELPCFELTFAELPCFELSSRLFERFGSRLLEVLDVLREAPSSPPSGGGFERDLDCDLPRAEEAEPRSFDLLRLPDLVVRDVRADRGGGGG